MTKVVYQALGPKARRRGKAGAVTKKRIVGPDGKPAQIVTIDANSSSFSADLHLAFTRNVAKARRENKKKFGSPDRVAEKA